MSAAQAADPAGTPARPPGRGSPPARVMTAIAVLLTSASGASDVASITRLGNVFTSVMTGNMALFGLSLARGSVSLAAHIAVAVAGYVLGVAAASRFAWHYSRRRPAAAASTGQGGHWPPHMTTTLLAEMTLFAGVIVGWELTRSAPRGTAQLVILLAAACAMGVQSAAVSQMGLRNVSTTYLTGTLTGMVRALAEGRRVGPRRPVVLLGLLAGAVLAGVFLAVAAAVVPLLPLAAIAAAILLGSGKVRPARLDADRRPAQPARKAAT